MDSIKSNLEITIHSLEQEINYREAELNSLADHYFQLSLKNKKLARENALVHKQLKELKKRITENNSIVLIAPSKFRYAGKLRRKLWRVIPGSVYNRELNRLRKWGGFDAEWYKSQRTDIESFNSEEAMTHFLVFGGHEGFSPKKGINIKRFIRENPQYSMTGTNPLFHMLETGAC